MSRGHGRAPIRERDVVATTGPPGPWLVRACWDAGAALLPVDPTLPAIARDALLAAAAPTIVSDGVAWSRRPGIRAGPGDALLIATSGTSGTPRLVVLQRAAVELAVRASASRLGLDGSEPWLACLPPWHIGGMLVRLRHLFLGSPLVVGELDAAAVAADRAVRCMSLVPTQLRRLVASGRRFDHLAAVLVGGDALDPGLRDSAVAAGIPVVHTYGQSQSCGGVVYDGVPLDGVGVAFGEDGEVLLEGATLMRGYRGDDAATASAFDGRGRLRTGDAGFLDGGGRLVVTGRLDDVIVTGGEKVVPADVEEVLRAVAGVGDVAVVGEPDAEWGSRVVAVVVPAAGCTLTLAALRDAVRASLPAYAAPKRLVTVDELPRTESGKLRRVAVRDRLRGG